MPSLWLGIGYQQGTSLGCLEAAISQLRSFAGLMVADGTDVEWINIVGIATIAHKTSDPALQALCQRHQWQLVGFSADQLAQVSVPHPSSTVASHLETSSVAEAAALLAAGAGADTAKLWLDKQVMRSEGQAITFAIAEVVSLK